MSGTSRGRTRVVAVDLQSVWLAHKRLPALRSWVEVRPDYIELVSPIDIDAVTVEGLRFRLTARKSLPDEAVTAQLEYIATKKSGGPFCRFDWRPLKAHDNKNHGPPELRRILQTGTHYHSFDVNWMYCAKYVRRGNLPVAIPVANDPASYMEALAFVGQEFRIDDVSHVLPPPWEEVLL